MILLIEIECTIHTNIVYQTHDFICMLCIPNTAFEEPEIFFTKHLYYCTVYIKYDID